MGEKATMPNTNRYHATRLACCTHLFHHIKVIMSIQTHNFLAKDATVCTELFTYIVVVFFLVRLSIDELGPEARRLGHFPPSGFLYLANILLWPITIGVFACLLVLGLLHSISTEACILSAHGIEVCCRRIASCFPNRRRVEDMEMRPFVPCQLEGVSFHDAEAENSCSRAGMAFRKLVATLKKECGLTPDEWGRAWCSSRSLAPLR